MNKMKLTLLIVFTILIIFTVLSCFYLYRGNKKKDTMPESPYDVNDFSDASISIVENSITTKSISVTVTYTGNKTATLGNWFVIEICKDDKWYALPIIEDYDIVGEAFPVGGSGARTMDYDWQYIYGSLPGGQYRIITSISDSMEAGKFKNYYLAAPFTIN